MKKIIIIIIGFFLLTVVESEAQKPTGNDDIIRVDVRNSYSNSKELLLQNLMDVEYIPLETNDDFVNQGVVMDIGKEIILVKNRINDGDIFVYSRTGKALRKINRKGQGGEEYLYIYNIILDEAMGEMFVNDVFKRKIFVYDLYGKFKRSFDHKKDEKSGAYSDIINFNEENLICYDDDNEEFPFVLISKKDGVITQKFKIPFKTKKFLRQSTGSDSFVYPVGHINYIFPFKGNWILSELSSDTVYLLLPDLSLRPFFFRNPPIQSMNPEVFLLLRFLSDRYLFMETIRNVYDSKTTFPKTFFVYDVQEKSFLNYKIYNEDYSTKKEIFLNLFRPLNHEIEAWQPLEPYILVEEYKKGILKGKLKEVAEKLDSEDNPVIMLVKHKK